jgi:hypothetical protein
MPVKPYLVGGFILTGLFLLASPLALLSVCFFDAPSRSPVDGYILYGIAGSLFLYPVPWGFALQGAIKAYNENRSSRVTAWLLVPILWLMTPALLALY